MTKLYNRVRKYGWIVIAITILGLGLFYLYANRKAQYYTASTILEYHNSEVGKNPDGTDIDATEIKSSYITGKALKSLNMTMNADVVSSQISIEPIVTDEEQALYESKLEHGEDYEIMSDQYVVTLSASTTYGKDYTKKMLNQVIEEYLQYYGEKYTDTGGVINNLDDIMTKGYDYIEVMDLTEASLSSTMDSLSEKIQASGTFRSNTTGLSFSDLYKEFQFYYNRGNGITAKILDKLVTKDRDVLLAKYKKKNSEMELETKANTKKINDIKKVIDSYVKMMENSGNAAFADKDILDAVYDEYSSDLKNTNHTTSYDELMQDYVQSRIGCEKNEIETAYNSYIIERFQSAESVSPEEEQKSVSVEISGLLKKTEELYQKFMETNTDYNSYIGIQHVKPLSSVCIQKKLPVKKYLILIAGALLIFGSIGFCVCSRGYDILLEIIRLQKEEERLEEKH